MSKSVVIACWLLILSILINEDRVGGRTIPDAMNNAIVRTIQVSADEIIDCFDIYRQPSLNHPLLSNQTIQITPSSYPEGIASHSLGTLQLTQTWHKYGSCPDKTIPIRRKRKVPIPLRNHNTPRLSSYASHVISEKDGMGQGHEYAGIELGGNFLGAHAKINLWKPITETKEISISQIWVTAGDMGTINTIEVGWEVDQFVYGDDHPRFFIYWTADGYHKSGCYNLECEGFVQVTSNICLGGVFSETSTLNGDQKDATFNIHKDKKTGNWWVHLQGTPVGYYPNSLFKELSKTATNVVWGGEILNLKKNGRHTSTQMGSGHFPSEGGLKTSSYFNWVQVVDENNIAKDPIGYTLRVTDPNCYDLKIDDGNHKTNGFGFYYGGPGYNEKCQ